MSKLESIRLNLRMFSTDAPFFGGESEHGMAHAQRLGGGQVLAAKAGNRNKSMSGRCVSGSAARQDHGVSGALLALPTFQAVLA